MFVSRFSCAGGDSALGITSLPHGPAAPLALFHRQCRLPLADERPLINSILVGGDHENPEYRIAEDLRVVTDAPVDFAAGVTPAFLSSATTFIIVLVDDRRR